MTAISDSPLVPIAGIAGTDHSITLYMRKGFDRTWAIDEVTLARLLDQTKGFPPTAPGKAILIIGDIANPYRWPVYARIDTAASREMTKESS